MNRSDFLKILAGIPALGLISLESAKQYEKVYLKNIFVRGFSYYDGPNIIHEINKCGQVSLVREPENKYDSKAIAIYFNAHKIGYVPQESNKTISILLDTELLEFHAEITEINPNESDWSKIRVAVYALKEIKNEDDYKKIEPYAALQTAHYYSLKSEGNRVIRLDAPSQEDLTPIKPEIEYVDTGYFVTRQISHNLDDPEGLSVMFTSYDTIAQLEETLQNHTYFTYLEELPPEMTEDNLRNLAVNLIVEYANCELKDTEASYFAINIHKWLDTNYCIKGFTPYYSSLNDVHFLEVNFSEKEEKC